MNSIGGFLEGLSNLVDTLRFVIDLAAVAPSATYARTAQGWLWAGLDAPGRIGDFDYFCIQMIGVHSRQGV